MTAPDPIRARLDELEARHASEQPNYREDCPTCHLLAAVRAVAELADYADTTNDPILGDDIRNSLAAALTTSTTRDDQEADRG